MTKKNNKKELQGLCFTLFSLPVIFLYCFIVLFVLLVVFFLPSCLDKWLHCPTPSVGRLEWPGRVVLRRKRQ